MKNITVTVDDAHLVAMKDVVEQLRTHGMRVDQVLYSVGIITGRIPDHDCSALGAVTGVDSVAEQQQFRVPHPDSEIQ
ncbi:MULTISPECIES: hypothetical protein [Bacteria]|uniref:hypothetical protein n=1 Tax=Bacteria TaxID=2 RepID=UPI0022E421AD|nr:hypothetical protein [Kocuria marina]